MTHHAPSHPANAIRGLTTAAAPLAPDPKRTVTAAEAAASLVRLTHAAVGRGVRPTIHFPAAPEDDDVVLAAYIARHGDGGRPAAPSAEALSVSDAVTDDNLGRLLAWLVGPEDAKAPPFIRSLQVAWPAARADRLRLAIGVLTERARTAVA